MEIGSKWIEWRGEELKLGGAGSTRETVVICVVSFLKNTPEPVYTIVPRAFFSGGVWAFFVGASNRANYLRTEYVNRDNEPLYMKSRGDKIYYCRPLLPSGEPIDFQTLISHFKWGYAPVKWNH